MPRGKGNLGNAGRPGILAAVLSCALAGCHINPHRADVEKNLLSERLGAIHNQDIAEKYLVACPDVLQVNVEGRNDFGGDYVVGPDGRILLNAYGPLRVEGLTLPAVAQAVGDVVGARPERVQVRVKEFSSRHLVLVGEVIGRHRTIPYQGSETVLDVLQRVGGITEGAEPTEIYVVRSHIGDLRRPEVFHVDLQAIVMKKDNTTNVRVHPYDQIFVGETRQARIEKCIPPWVRPTYQTVWNMLPSGNTPQEKEHSFTDWIRGWLPFTDPPAKEE